MTFIADGETQALAHRDLQSEQDVAYRALLRPHRSLTGPAFNILIIAFAIVSVVVGGFFLMLGAWPVTGYFGIDLLALYLAFRWNYRAARQCEHITVERAALSLQRVLPSGERQCWQFNPYWAQVECAKVGRDRSELRLISHGKRVVFGAFLPEHEKRALAERLQRVLQQVRGAGSDPLILAEPGRGASVPTISARRAIDAAGQPDPTPAGF